MMVLAVLELFGGGGCGVWVELWVAVVFGC